MLVENPDNINEKAVGCILLFNSRYFLIHRKKDDLWNSVTGLVRLNETPKGAIIRELKEELNISIEPSFLNKSYHDYDGKIVEYNLFYFDLVENPYDIITFDKNKIIDVGLFSLNEALSLDLYEDEDYCLELYNKIKK